MTSASQHQVREPHSHGATECQQPVLGTWQQLDPTIRLCLVEQALQPPARLHDGYPAAL